MFGTGPEFLLIAIVALVVLGPERLPEVMRTVGRVYRQARELMQQYSAEAQRMFEEGMREVEDVSNTINTAWQEATTTTPSLPPPPLRQLPPPLQAPSTAADAGPWVLPAWHRDGAVDREPQPGRSPATPFALHRQAPPDGLGATSSSGGPALSGPAPSEEELAAVGALGAELPDPAAALAIEIPAIPQMAPLPAAERSPAGLAPAPGAPRGGNGLPTTPPANGAATLPAGEAPPGAPPEPAGTERERTVIELYLQGGLSWPQAAAFLHLTPAEFLDRLERARGRQPAGPLTSA